VHSPKCGSGNRPIDKAAAARALRLLLAREPLPAFDSRRDARPEGIPATTAAQAEEPVQHRIVYVDIETQRGADEVGGWHNAHLMRVAVAVIYDEIEARFETFEEADVSALLERLEAADLVVGFNVRRFDYAVLRGYTDRDLTRLPTFDMLEAIHRQLGFRLPLGHLAQETLGAAKSADGLQSLRWWKQRRIDLISEYCRQDVALLRDLLRHAEEHGHLFFRTREGQRVRLPARWRPSELVDRARSAAYRPAMEYSGATPAGAAPR
jgi:DEAD/DEAH box helicase domain-containing protein